jgi:hypothetical protein
MQPVYYAQQSALARLVTFFETLTPQTLTRLEPVYGADARFRDPFNDVLGHAPPSAVACISFISSLLNVSYTPHVAISYKLVTRRNINAR